MFFNYKVIIVGLAFLCSPFYVLACNCEIRNTLNFKDWNDAPIIFKAYLKDYVQTSQFVKLSFTNLEILKGKVKKDVTIFIKTNESHTLIHGIKRFHQGDNWIVFAEYDYNGRNEYLRLLDSEDSAYCALSRPIKNESDIVIDFIQSFPFAKTMNIYKTESSGIKISGVIENGSAIGNWKYSYPTGTFCTTEYKNGLKHGYELWYSKDSYGVYYKSQEKLYDQGRKKYLKLFDSSGTLREWIVYGETENFMLRFRSNKPIGKWVYNKLDESTTAYLMRKNGMKIFKMNKPIKELR